MNGNKYTKQIYNNLNLIVLLFEGKVPQLDFIKINYMFYLDKGKL